MKKKVMFLMVACIAVGLALSFALPLVMGEEDTDGDDLPDVEEIEEYGTDPDESDTDGDDYDDGVEIDEGTDPLDPESHPVD